MSGAGIAIVTPLGRLLFLKRSTNGDHPGTWCFPGGGPEAGETPIQTALRECREEIGPPGQFTEAQLTQVDLRDAFTTFTTEVPEEFTPLLNSEHTEFRWAHPDDAPAPLHPGVAETLSMTTHTRDFAGYYAPEKIGTTRKMTPEGFLVLEGTPIARTGEQLYAGHEVQGIEANRQGFITVERPPEEVFSDDTLRSFEGKDFVIEHPPDGVDTHNWDGLSVGHVQNVRRGTGIDDDLIIADIIVKNPEAVKYVNKHLPDLSAGYRADYEQVEPGRAIQRNIIGNHVAAVKAGRAGARVAVRDHATQTDQTDEVYNMSQRSGRLATAVRATLAAVGVKIDDSNNAKVDAAIAAAVATHDAKEDEDPDDEPEGKVKDKTYDALSRDMKTVLDWIKARDAEREEEKKAKEKEVADRKAKDEETAHEKGKKAAEAAEHEAVGDTILEAESPGHVLNLGRTWTGSMTGDAAAQEPVLSAIVSRSEVLAPGLAKPTADSIKGTQGRALAQFMRDSLNVHVRAAGRGCVQPFLVGDAKIEDLRGERLMQVFMGAAQLARQQNNGGFFGALRRPAAASGHTTNDQRPKTIADMNANARKYWADRKQQQSR